MRAGGPRTQGYDSQNMIGMEKVDFAKALALHWQAAGTITAHAVAMVASISPALTV